MSGEGLIAMENFVKSLAGWERVFINHCLEATRLHFHFDDDVVAASGQLSLEDGLSCASVALEHSAQRRWPFPRYAMPQTVHVRACQGSLIY